ncbi:MAG: alpha/beta family hydrolase [Bdellovibrionales bacterium]
MFLFAHGAGAPMDSDWMNGITKKLKQKGLFIKRFEFPYMAERRRSGKKRPPDRQPVLLEAWKSVIAEHRSYKKIFVGGKSMGGRMASLIADEMQVSGLIVLGFPFHAPGKEPGERIEHLKSLKTPTLILQGERDSMGSKQDIQGYSLSHKIRVSFLEDGDHSFKPRKKSGFSQEDHMETAATKIFDFIYKEYCLK